MHGKVKRGMSRPDGSPVVLEARAAQPRSSRPRIDITPLVCRLMCGNIHMATNLAIDPKLIERALAVSGERTKKAAVTKALEEFVARRRQKTLLELMAKLEWDDAFDYKKERNRD